MDIDYKNISIDELSTYQGSICLYALNFEDNLGDSIKEKYKELLKGNSIGYKDSLALENECNLIIVDADDFNPSKMFGLTKKYECPVVFFISKEDKLNKLKKLLIRNILIIDKNTTKQIDIRKDVEKNIEEKIKKDKERKLKKIEDEKKQKEVEEDEVVLVSEEMEEIPIAENTEDKKNEEITNIKNDIDKKLTIGDSLTNEKVKLNKVAYYTNDIKIIQNLNDIFGKELYKINFLNEKQDYDILFIDTTFSSVFRQYNFIKELKECPLIIMGNRKSKIEELVSLVDRDVLVLEKPLSISRDELYYKVLEYLNNLSFEKVEEKLIKANPIRERDSRVFDNDYEEKLKNSFNKYINKVKVDKETVKKEIYKTNKRSDKDLSLEYIYEKMGLNNIAAFDSKLNKYIYTTSGGKVIKYMPSGYLIEYRIKRLKRRGLSNEQINETLKKLEESDIKFQKNMFKRKEEKKNMTINYKEVFLEKVSYKDLKREGNLFNNKVKEINDNITCIDFDIFKKFKNFIITYRKMKKEMLNKSLKREKASSKKVSKPVNIKEKQAPLKNSFVKSSIHLNRKRLEAIKGNSQTIKSNNNENDNIKHKEFDITLDEINEKLPGKNLLEKHNFYEMSEDDYEENSRSKKTSIFESSNVRPPRTDL